MQPISPGRVVTPVAALSTLRSGLHPVVAVLLWALAIACPILIITLVALAPSPPEDAWAIPLYALIVATWGVTGAFVAARKPDNRIGWLLWLVGVGIGLALAGRRGPT